MKKELLHLSANYFVTKDKEGSLESFVSNLGIPEAKVLSMALLQGEKTGRTTAIISSLSSGLFNTAIAKVNRDEKAVQNKVLLALFILMVAAVTVYMQPHFAGVLQGLRTIF